MDKNYKPGHKLAAFILVIVCLYGLIAIGRSWTPRLGLDLRGGTTVTLTARTNSNVSVGGAGAPAPTGTDATPSAPDTGAPTATASTGTQGNNGGPSAESMQEALNIIQQRVDSLGVGNSSITLQGASQIQVAVPNVDAQTLANLVGQTAVLVFRNVYSMQQATPPAPSATDTGAPAGNTPPDTQVTVSVPPAEASTPPATPAEETVAPASPAPTETAPPTETTSPARRIAPMLPTAPPSVRPTEPGSNQDTSFEGLMNWQPSAQDTEQFASWNCGDPFPDVWDQPLFACNEQMTAKYLLGPAIIQGQHVTDAKAGVPQGQVSYIVTLSFDAIGTSQFGIATAKLVKNTSPMNQFAIVLDGKVVSAPAVQDAIPGGSAQITGNFSADEAQSLARVLRYGALPLTFDISSQSTVSPTLGGEQLKAGIIAGLIGLILTMLYAMLYYRGLSIIVIGSLVSAAVITYASIVLLGSTVGFALNLPGIAGVILAIGVTADSFIVYFERIRDEIRDGYSLAHAVESGWLKARSTIVVADGVQLLSALVLFFLAIGEVRGFAFTLLVTTLIDVYIVFFFSKPLMTLLARTRYFRSGRPMSGFDPDHLGVSPEALRGRRASTGTIKRSARQAVKEA